MSSLDDNQDPPNPARPPGKPSLVGGAAAPRASGSADRDNLRMLAGLEGSGAGSGPATPRRSWTGILALLALIVVAAALWWWNQQRTAPASPAPQAGSMSAPVAAAPAEVASAVAEAAPPATAPIETTAEAATAAAAEASAPEAVTTAKTDASKLAKADKPQSAKQARATSKAISAKASTASRTSVARRPAASEPATLVASREADVDLLAALLAHVARDDAEALGANEQVTIAQIVRRCEMRGVKDGAAESRECRRRICDGYWGKAEACPARLAPRKG